MANQNRQISDECFLQGLCEEEPFILAFIKKHKIKLYNVRGFIIAWRLNPVRQKMAFSRRAVKTEADNKALADRYFTALQNMVAAFTVQGGKLPQFKKVERAGLTIAQKEKRRQEISRQLEDY